MKSSMINKIGERTCRCGTTTWIVEAALNNPNVIILCVTHNQVESIKHMINSRFRKMSLIKRFFWNRRNKGQRPTVLTVESFLHNGFGLHKPVILDNSVYYWINK